MFNAYGAISARVVDGNLSFEATYQQTYRHAWLCLGWFASEQAAIRALVEEATHDGRDIVIQAGEYPRGTRRRGQIITQEFGIA